METQIFEANQLEEAAQLLAQGQLVAFPTETVYGLGAIATDASAIQQVYHVKGRPSDNPLIVHVKDSEQVARYVRHLSPLAKDLMARFWPGPLTLILPVEAHTFPENLNQGRDTVAFRMPQQTTTLRLIDLVGLPLVGPSANLSGKPSPTCVAHVLDDFDGVIAGVVSGDTDQAQIGVESTVVRPLDDRLVILRPGAITQSMLAEVCPRVEELSAQQQLAETDLLSPGVKYRHYSPQQPVYLFYDHWDKTLLLERMSQRKGQIGLLADQAQLDWLGNQPQVMAQYSLGPRGHAASATRQLYAGLRALEASGCDWILAQAFDQDEKFHAYMNRLNKAATSML